MTSRKLSMIVAASTNDVIGVDGDLPWRLSADLKRFRKLTMGHHIIMGRKTFESIPKLLDGRISVIVTRQPDFRLDGKDPLGDEAKATEQTGYKVANSIEKAVELCGADECPFITGGAEIYRLSLPLITEIQLTRVHLEIEGDTMLPEIDWDQWHLTSQSDHSRDEKNQADYSFQVFQRQTITTEPDDSN